MNRLLGTDKSDKIALLETLLNSSTNNKFLLPECSLPHKIETTLYIYPMGLYSRRLHAEAFVCPAEMIVAIFSKAEGKEHCDSYASRTSIRA